MRFSKFAIDATISESFTQGKKREEKQSQIIQMSLLETMRVLRMSIYREYTFIPHTCDFLEGRQDVFILSK